MRDATRLVAGTGFGKHREVETHISQFPTGDVLPVYTCAHRLRRLPVGEALGKMHHGDKGKLSGGLGGKVLDYEQGCEKRILCRMYRAHCAFASQCGPLRKAARAMCDVFGDTIN